MSASTRHKSTYGVSSAPKSLSRLESPTFPRFHEFVDPHTFAIADGVAALTSKRAPQGLFETLLGGDVAVLHQDATENPDKYDDATVGLLAQLVQSRRKHGDLEEAERGLLDLATLTFSSYVPPKKVPKLESPLAPPMQKFAEEDDGSSFDHSSSDGDAPETDTPAYWWL